MTTATGGVRTNTLALVAFIAAFFVPLLGLILGIVARRQLDASGNVEAGRGFSRWAMVIGALGTVLQVGFVIFWIALFTQTMGSLPAGS